MLAAIGFSYVALRLVDVIRAVQEGRHRPPDLASTLNYLLPFHMLAAGPIQSYDQFVAQPGVPPPLTIARSYQSNADFRAIQEVCASQLSRSIIPHWFPRTWSLLLARGSTQFHLAVSRLQRTVMWRSAWELSSGSIHRRTSESPTGSKCHRVLGSAGIFRSPNSSADTCLFQLELRADTMVRRKSTPSGRQFAHFLLRL